MGHFYGNTYFLQRQMVELIRRKFLRINCNEILTRYMVYENYVVILIIFFYSHGEHLCIIVQQYFLVNFPTVKVAHIHTYSTKTHYYLLIIITRFLST